MIKAIKKILKDFQVKSDMNDKRYKKPIQAITNIQRNKIKDKQIVKSQKKKILALEGQIDILNTTVVNVLNTQKTMRKNNFQTFESQTSAIYQMFNGTADYGSDLMRALIETRVALICGEGINIHAKGKTAKFIQKFIDDNQLNGYRLLNMVQSGEMEGKQLLVLLPDEEMIKVRQFSWYVNKYTIKTNKRDNDDIINISYRDDDDKPHTISIDKSVYVKLGGSEDKVNDTFPRIGTVITQIENYDRALYDLRANNHLFSKLTPYWKTETQAEAKAINNAVNGGEWELGKGYAGTGAFSIVGPPLGALESLKGEMSLNLKLISSTAGVPVHWLGWTDLMSNRALADELEQFVDLATKKERLIWIEKLKEVIRKAMILAVDSGIEGAVNDPDGFELDLPIVSMEKMKALSETWLVLYQESLISRSDIQNKIPGIDPIVTNKQIEKEKEEALKNNPLAFDNMKVEEEDDTEENTEKS